MITATPTGRLAILGTTGSLAVLSGALIALADDDTRLLGSLALLAAGLTAYGIVRVWRQVRQSRAKVGRPPWLVRATYVLGLASGGLLVLRPGGGFTVSDLVFVVSFVLCLASLVRRDRRARGISPWLGIGVGIFAIGALVSSIGAIQASESVGILLRFGFVAWAWLWLGVQVIDDWSMLRLVTTAWALGGALAASGAVLQAMYGDIIPGTSIAWGRMTGFTQNVNDLGGLCGVAVPISLSLITDAVRNKRPGVPLYVALAVLNVAGVTLSGSVGGIAAALVGILVVARATRWSLGLGVAAAATVVAVAISSVAFGVGAAVLVRYATVTGPAGDPSATWWSRLESFSAAWQVIQRQPLVGVGLAPGGAVTETGFAVHNVLIAAWYQAGILGGVGIALVLGVAVTEGLRAFRQVPRLSINRDLIAGIAGSLAAAIVFGFGAPVLYQRYFWVPVAMILAVRALGGGRQAMPSATPPTKHVGRRP